MRARMRVNGAAFERIRTRTEALQLSEGDRSGPLLRALDTVHCAQVTRAFSTQGASTGSPWQPWSVRYQHWRDSLAGRRRSIGKRIMVLTGSLLGKATSPIHGDHVARWEGGLRFSFGFLDEPGYIHMNTEAGRSKMPLRSALIKTDADYLQFLFAFSKFWRSRIQQALRHA